MSGLEPLQLASALAAALMLVQTGCAGGDRGLSGGSAETGGSGEAGAAGTGDGTGGMPSTGPGPTAACEHVDLEIFLVTCADGYAYLRTWTPVVAAPSCAVYYTLDAEEFDSQRAALDSQACDARCLLPPSMCVTLLRCSEKTGYIVYADPEAPRCPSLVETPDGIFTSVDEWNAQFPCPR